MLNSNVRTAAAVAVAKGKLISSLFKMHPSTHASTSSSCINKNDVDHGDIYEDDEDEDEDDKDKAITLSKSSAGSSSDDQLWRQIMDQTIGDLGNQGCDNSCSFGKCCRVFVPLWCTLWFNGFQRDFPTGVEIII